MCTSNTFGARSVRRHTAVIALAFLVSLGLTARIHAQCPAPPMVHEDIAVDADGLLSSLAIRQCGEFLIAWEGPKQVPSMIHDNALLAQSFDPVGATINGPYRLNDTASGYRPSAALSRNGFAKVSWTGIAGPLIVPNPVFSLLQIDFAFDDLDAIVPPVTPFIPHGEAEWRPSSGSSDLVVQMQNVTGVTWAKRLAPDQGLNYQVDGVLGEIEECGAFCVNRVRQWQPCLSMRSEDAYMAVAWAQPESAIQEPRFNIAVRVYDSDGNLVDQRDGSGPTDPWVNDPALEVPFSSQLSPAVSFVADDILVTWVGLGLADCDGFSANHIYARRYKFDTATETLRDPVPGIGEGRAGLFVVDNDDDPQILIDPATAHPTVALTLEQGANAGRFAVAWNTGLVRDATDEEVRIQYFDPRGDPRGAESRVHVAATTDDMTEEVFRIADSGQGTLGYAADDQVIVTWGSFTAAGAPDGISFTILPSGHAETLGTQCCKGDINADGLLDGNDIQPFVDQLIGGGASACMSVVNLCPADMNSDGVLDLDDVTPFVAVLLDGVSCGVVGGESASGGSGGGPAAAASAPLGGAVEGSASVAAGATAEATAAAASTPPSTPDFDLTPAELDVWMAFFDWCDEQNWATETSEEQMLREMADKLRELGIEVEGMEQYESPGG